MKKWMLSIALFCAALATTTAHGLSFAGEALEAQNWWSDPSVWAQGLMYSLSVMAILFAHEMGHYITARRYGVQVSPPYFLPGLPPFGTFGAFIKMEIDEISAKELFRIGAGGPYAGFVLTLPILVSGLLMSEVQPLPEGEDLVTLGDSLLMWILVKLVFGELPGGHDVFLHPMAYAGWVGMFVTSFNLVPLGQLDGGHVLYTLFGERFNKAAWFIFGLLVLLGVFVFQGWLVLAVFLLVMGPKHPPVVRGEPSLEGVDKWAAYGALIMLLLTFIPQPFNVSIWDVFG